MKKLFGGSIFLLALLGAFFVSADSQIIPPSGGGGGGGGSTTCDTTTNLLAGSGLTGGCVSSGIAPANVPLLNASNVFTANYQTVKGLLDQQDGTAQLIIRGVSNANQNLTLDYDTAGGFSAIDSFEQTVGGKVLKLNPGGGQVQVGSGGIQVPLLSTTTNCSQTASPAVCAAAAAGKVQLAASATTLTINTTAVSGNSECWFGYSTAGLTAPTNLTSLGPISETAQVAATSVSISIPVAPLTNPINIKYSCVN